MKLIHAIVLFFVLPVMSLALNLKLFAINAFYTLAGTGQFRYAGMRPGVKVTQAVSTQGFKLEVSVDTGTTWVEVKGITDIPDPTGEASDLDATNLASTSKEYIAGLRDSQSATVTGQRYATDPGQNILRDYVGNAAPLKFRNTYSDGEILTYSATVKKFAVTGGVDAVQMFTTSFRGSGTGAWSGTGVTP